MKKDLPGSGSADRNISGSVLIRIIKKKPCLFFSRQSNGSGSIFRKEPDFSVPLHFSGTEFQKEVWKLLCDIPYGQTVTYGELARSLALQKGIPHMSAQAVGGAVGHNKISILVPCHRVLGSGGSLTGYAGGLDKKRYLLKLEHILI